MQKNNEQDQILTGPLAKFQDIPEDVLDLLYRAYEMNWNHLLLIGAEAMAVAQKTPDEVSYPHREPFIESLHEFIIFSYDIAKALDFHGLSEMKEVGENYKAFIERE